MKGTAPVWGRFLNVGHGVSAMDKTVALVFAGVCFVALSAAAPGEFPSSSGIIALNSLPDPSATLATASVADAKGTMVGAVKKIVLDTNGKPKTVEVALMGSNAVVAIDASRFNY